MRLESKCGPSHGFGHLSSFGGNASVSPVAASVGNFGSARRTVSPGLGVKGSFGVVGISTY